MPFRYTAGGSQTTTSRDPLKYYATAKKNEIQFGKGQKMVTFMTNLIATISVKKRRAAR